MMAESFPGALRRRRSQGGTFASVWSRRLGVEREVSYGEFAEAVASGSRYFREELGVGFEARVALLCKGTVDFYVAVVSLQAAGLTPCFLNWQQPAATLTAMVVDAAAGVVAAGAPFQDLGREVAASSQRRLLLLDADSDVARQRQWSWSLSRSFSSPRAAEARPSWSETEEAAVFFTTGSTSRPKPVLHTNETLMWTAENFVFPTKDMVRTLCFMPNFHVLMCFQNFLLPLARGVGCCIHGADATESMSAQLLLLAAAALKPTTVDTVPFILEDWATMTKEELAPLAACAAVRSGGAPLSATVAQHLVCVAGLRVQTHYGQTEAPGMQLLTVPGAAPSELAVFLPPWPQVEIRLVADAADEAPTPGSAAQGELWIRNCGGSSPGYLEAGLLVPGSGKKDAGGWHRTGDIFKYETTQSGERGLRHVSRVDDVLVLSTGEMMNPVPAELALRETLLNAKDDVVSSVVDRIVILGQNRPRPVLVVEMARGCGQRTEAQLRTALWPRVADLNKTLPNYARMGNILIVPSKALPVSVKGSVIRPRAEAGLEDRLDDLATSPDTTAELLALLGGGTGPPEIKTTTPLKGHSPKDDGLSRVPPQEKKTSLGFSLASWFSTATSASATRSSGPLVDRSAAAADDDEDRGGLTADMIEKKVDAYFSSGRTITDVIDDLKIDSMTASRLYATWRRKCAMKGVEGPTSTFKVWLCNQRPVGGRSLATVLRNEAASSFYRSRGLFEGIPMGFNTVTYPGDQGEGIRVTNVLARRRTRDRGDLYARVYASDDGGPGRGRRASEEQKDGGAAKKDEKTAGPTKGRPCIVEIPGDAFFGYSRARPIPYFATRLGFAVAQADRRGSHEGGVFPNALADVACCVRAIRGNAAELGIDPERIGVFGESSGGWFSAMLTALSDVDADDGVAEKRIISDDDDVNDEGSSSSDTDKSDRPGSSCSSSPKESILQRLLGAGEAGEFPHLSSSVRCGVAFYPPTRFDRLDDQARHEGWSFLDPKDAADSPESLFLGGPIQAVPETVQAAAPQTYVSSRTPPLLLVHGDIDPMVSVAQSRDLFRALAKARDRKKTKDHADAPSDAVCGVVSKADGGGEKTKKSSDNTKDMSSDESSASCLFFENHAPPQKKKTPPPPPRPRDDPRFSTTDGRLDCGVDITVTTSEAPAYHEYLEVSGEGHATPIYGDAKLEAKVMQFYKTWLQAPTDES